MMTEKYPWDTFYQLEEVYHTQAKAAGAMSVDLGDWLPELGRVTRPRVPGEMVLFIGDTGTGKTSTFYNIAYCLQWPCLVFQLELSKAMSFERGASIANEVAGVDVERRYHDDGVLPIDKLDHIHMVHLSGLHVDRIAEIVHQFKDVKGLEFAPVFIDYVGLMRGPGGSRYERATNIAEGLKSMANDTESVVFVNSQIPKRGPDDPVEIALHDAKDSGALEYSAQLVMGMWRDPQIKEKMVFRKLKDTRGKTGYDIYAHLDGRTSRITPWKEDWE